jgi:ADP-ribose pyrophosphatase YjhB (NUDIX family)
MRETPLADMSDYVEIETDAWRFQPRVAAVCIWQDHVLLQKAIDGEFWVLPGGRVQPLELTADALIRTMRWEIDQEVAIHRLLWVMEYVASIGGRPVHELGFYYAIELPKESPFRDLSRDHAGVERGHDLMLRWFPIDALPNVPLVPDFLRTAMRELPDGPQHIVSVDVDRPHGMAR